MFSINSNVLRDALSMVTAIGNEISLAVTPEGITTTVIDMTHVALVGATLESAVFEEYAPVTGEYAVDLAVVRAFVKSVPANSTVKFSVEDGILSIKCGKFRRTTAIKGDVNPRPRVPSVNPENAVSSSVSILSNAIKSVSGIGDNLYFTLGREEMEIKSSDKATEECILTIGADELNQYFVDDCFRICFSAEYISRIVQSLPPEAIVEMWLSKDIPMKIIVKNIPFDVIFYVAPRIESE